ncbi:MAG: hypothetical protein ACOX60_04830 [Massiliimalia sp.]
MDEYLCCGDTHWDLCGDLKFVDGLDERIQRAMIRLTMRKGSFPYDTSLGSELADLDIHSADDFTLYSVVSEALKDLEGVELLNVQKETDFETETLYLTVYLKVEGSVESLKISASQWSR